MKIEDVYTFLFHPLSEKHSETTQVVSVITIVALSALTFTGFLWVFGVVNLCEKNIQHGQHGRKIDLATRSFFQGRQAEDIENQTMLINSSFTGAESATSLRIYKKNQEQLVLFEIWAKNNQWVNFETAHYDWWAFPVNRTSQGHGDLYTVGPKELATLKNNNEFMHGYRTGVELVVKSWGWDLETEQPVIPEEKFSEQRWIGYGVRLGKMADSLWLFEEFGLYKKLQTFYAANCLRRGAAPLEDWVHDSLTRDTSRVLVQ